MDAIQKSILTCYMHVMKLLLLLSEDILEKLIGNEKYIRGRGMRVPSTLKKKKKESGGNSYIMSGRRGREIKSGRVG